MSMLVLTGYLVLATGEPLTWYWLLAIPALALQAVFNVGMGLFLARLGARADDFSQLLPFLSSGPGCTPPASCSASRRSRLWLRHHPTLTYLLQINPAAVYISLVRNAILQSQRNACARQQAVQRGQLRSLPCRHRHQRQGTPSWN